MISSKVVFPAPDGPNLRVRRLYTRNHAIFSLVFWLALVAILTPLAIEFTSRIQSTLSGMKGTPSEKVRINVVKNFSTALAFPTAVVWDAKGLPQAAQIFWGSSDFRRIFGMAPISSAAASLNAISDGPAREGRISLPP